MTAANFGPLSAKLLEGGARTWQENSTEGDSLYVLDPDGHKLEIHVGSLESRLASIRGEQ